MQVQVHVHCTANGERGGDSFNAIFLVTTSMMLLHSNYAEVLNFDSKVHRRLLYRSGNNSEKQINRCVLPYNIRLVTKSTPPPPAAILHLLILRKLHSSVRFNRPTYLNSYFFLSLTDHFIRNEITQIQFYKINYEIRIFNIGPTCSIKLLAIQNYYIYLQLMQREVERE